MAWKFCNTCKRSYNDTKGGCTTIGCAEYSAAPKAPVKPAESPSAVKKPIPPPKPVHLASVGKPTPPPKKTPAIKPAVAEGSSAEAEVEALQWINAPVGNTPPLAIPLIQTFTLTCYRGEKSEWWPEPKLRLACGMTVFEPWAYDSISDLWKKLIAEMRTEGGSPGGFAQHLRASGKPYAIATARSRGGAFEGYNYEIEIPNVRTFHWGPNFTLGPPANFLTAQKQMTEQNVNGKLTLAMTDSVTADYIVLNANTIEASTILGFGHKTATYEVTFMHDLPIEYIKKCGNELISSMKILTKEQVGKLPDNALNRTAKKLLR